MNTASIPATRDDLVTDLTAAGDLLRATGWQLAATVWAWTTEGAPGPRSDEKSSELSVSAFARLGVRGLTTRDSVRRYRRAWQEAMDAGVACSVEPGDKVELPDVTLWTFDGDGRLVDLSESSDADQESSKKASASLDPLERVIAMLGEHLGMVPREVDIQNLTTIRDLVETILSDAASS